MARRGVFQFEGFRLDRQSRVLFRRDEAGAFVPIVVGSRALDVLDVLLDRAGNLVLRDELMAAVWPATTVEDTNLNMQIAALRRILDEGRADGSCIQVIAPIDLAIYPGQIVALLGASGCGKSTLMRMLTGLSPSTGGAVYWHGQPVDGRFPNVSMVFQSFALFPWLTVIENVEAPLKARRRDRPSASRSGRGSTRPQDSWPVVP